MFGFQTLGVNLNLKCAHFETHCYGRYCYKQISSPNRCKAQLTKFKNRQFDEQFSLICKIRLITKWLERSNGVLLMAQFGKFGKFLTMAPLARRVSPEITKDSHCSVQCTLRLELLSWRLKKWRTGTMSNWRNYSNLTNVTFTVWLFQDSVIKIWNGRSWSLFTIRGKPLLLLEIRKRWRLASQQWFGLNFKFKTCNQSPNMLSFCLKTDFLD